MNNHFYRWFGRPVRQGAASKSLLKTALMAITMLVSISIYAQDKTVSGKVTDKGDGSGMPGVSVSVKGSNRGTQTDINGAYKIAAGSNATLVFSFVGYAKQEVAVGNRSELNVSLASEDKALDEVVVIGYGTQKVKDATGSVSSLSSKDFNKGVINSPEQLLQGRVAGVQMTPNSGDPGAGININIRGTASLRGNNNPLFVVDNVPLDNSDVVNNAGAVGIGTVTSRNPLNFLNPADIENISILKDASAAAIYGARGANGVVLITTKKGKSGAGVFNFSMSGSVASAAKKYDLLSPSEFKAEMQRAGQDVNNKLIIGSGSTDWQEQVLRTAFTQNYNMSFGGGSDKTSYFFSLGYQDQQGIIKNTSQDKVQARINASHKLFDDKVTVGVALTTAKINDVYGATSGNVGFDGNLVSRMINLNPTFPVYATDGSYFTTGGVSFRNPVSLLNNFHQYGPTNRTLANIFASWEIVKGLTYKASLSQDNVATTLNSYVDVNTPGFQNSVPNNAGGATIGNQNRTTSTIEHTLNFKKVVGKHDIEALAGFSYQKFANSGSNVQANYFTVPAGTNLTNNIGYVDNTGSNKPFNGTSFANQSELQSYFGRASYNYDGKYYLTGTLRVDGSSKFGANNKYGYFPAVNGAWKISGEEFMKDSFFSNLKLRAGYGVTGNSEGFPANQTVTTFIPNANNAGISKENIANADLKWESTTSYGLGIDFSVMKGRLSGTVDYFNKTTNNLLFPLSAPQPDVATTRWSNLDASVVNKGVEVTLAYDVIKSGDFTWTASANATFLDNKLEKLNNTVLTGDIFGQGLSGAYVQPLTAGYPLYSFFVPEFKGFDAKGQNILSEKSIYAGSPFPTMSWGLNNDLSFGKWSVGMFINGQSGGYIFNNTALALGGAPTLNQGNNSDKSWIDAKESFTNGLAASTRFVEKSDFVRLSNLSISRRIAVESKHIKGLSVSLSGQNLLLISSYKGLDPEVTNPGASRNGIASRGIDYVSYPKARTFTLSLSANF